MKKQVLGRLLSGLPALLAALMLISPSTASAQSIPVTLNADNVPVKTVMAQIEGQTKYLFVYNDEIDVKVPVSVSVKEQPLSSVLVKVFEKTPIAFTVSGTNIVLSKKAAPVAKPEGKTTITGTVTDATTYPVIGAGIFLKGTTIGATTDVDGKFSFEIPSESFNAGQAIAISCLGYKDVELALGGNTDFAVVLEDDAILMEGTVVTALGIKRSEKALSYNVQQVNSDELLANKDANFVNSLNGKVAGLVINSSSAGVGGASKVVMRGSKSVAKSSNALYVIDGVPMFTIAGEASTGFSSRGYSDPIADINPEDIESMSVLTGAAAAALYGSDAANGAIVVTTKKGKAGKTSLTISSNTELYTVATLPEFQNTYGTGDLRSSESSVIRSWGNKLDKSLGYSPRHDYFKMGVMGTENVSLSTGTEKNQIYISAAAVNSRGNVPNNAYDRYNFSFRNTTSFLQDKLTLDVGASYVKQYDRNMLSQGTYNNPVVGAYIFPRGDDWTDVKMFERWDSARKIYTQYWPQGDAGMTLQNPYWINYRNLREDRKDRYMMNANLSYKICDWMTLSGRVRIDNTEDKFEEKSFASTNTQLTEYSQNGAYTLEKGQHKQVYADALLDINKTWNDWSLHANLGASISDMRYDLMRISGPIADGMVDPSEPTNVPNVFMVSALSQSKTVKAQSGWREQTQSIYASAELGYKGTYYLTLTGRNDWPSQLAGPRSGSKSFFYPSVGASVVLSQIINMPEQLEYVKIRGSYASVGSAFARFKANPLFTKDEKATSWNTQTSYPMEDMKPEKTNSWEVGLSMRFLKDFNADVTFYNTHTLNQTLYPQISTGSGYSEIAIQSGDVRNRGIEVSVGFNHTWNRFSWQSNYTFSANRNKIVNLADNAKNPVTGEDLDIQSLNMGGLGNVRFILRKGGSLGDIYSRCDLKRDSNNDIYVNADGSIAIQNIDKVEDYIKLGSVDPKANMAWRNDFKYGNFNFGFMVTARLGGVVYSHTQARLDYYGVSKASAEARNAGGMMINGSDFVDANNWFTTIGGGDAVPQYYTYSATNVRLQEATLGYTFPRKMFKGVCDLTLQLVGRNLWMLYCKAPFDPETVASTANYFQGMDHFMMPSTRNFGFNVRVNF